MSIIEKIKNFFGSKNNSKIDTLDNSKKEIEVNNNITFVSNNNANTKSSEIEEDIILDRVEYSQYRKLFIDNYEKCKTDNKSYLLSLVGDGAVGKSTTNDNLCEYLDEKNIKYTRLNFNEKVFKDHSNYCGLIVLRAIAQKIYSYKNKAMIDFYALWNIFAENQANSLCIDIAELDDDNEKNRKELIEDFKGNIPFETLFERIIKQSGKENYDKYFNTTYANKIALLNRREQKEYSALTDVFCDITNNFIADIGKPFVIILDNSETIYNDKFFSDLNLLVIKKLFSKLNNVFWIFSGRENFKLDYFKSDSEEDQINIDLRIIKPPFELEGISTDIVLQLLNNAYKIKIDGRPFTYEEADFLRSKAMNNSMWIQMKIDMMLSDKYKGEISSSDFNKIAEASSKKILERFLGQEMHNSIDIKGKDYGTLDYEAKSLLLFAFLPQMKRADYEKIAGLCDDFSFKPSHSQNSFIKIKDSIFYMQPAIEEAIHRFVMYDNKSVESYVRFREEIQEALLKIYNNNATDKNAQLLGSYLSKYGESQKVIDINKSISNSEHKEIFKEQIFANSYDISYVDYLFKDSIYSTREYLSYLHSCYVEYCYNKDIFSLTKKELKNNYYDFKVKALENTNLKNELDVERIVNYFERMIEASYALANRTIGNKKYEKYFEFAMTNIISMIIILKRIGKQEKYLQQREKFLDYVNNITCISKVDNAYALEFYCEELKVIKDEEKSLKEELSYKLLKYCTNRISSIHDPDNEENIHLQLLDQTLFQLSKVPVDFKSCLHILRVEIAKDILEIVKDYNNPKLSKKRIVGAIKAYQAYSKTAFEDSDISILKELFLNRDNDKSIRFTAQNVFFDECEKEKDMNLKASNLIVQLSRNNESIRDIANCIGNHYSAILFPYIRQICVTELDQQNLDFEEYNSIIEKVLPNRYKTLQIRCNRTQSIYDELEKKYLQEKEKYDLAKKNNDPIDENFKKIKNEYFDAKKHKDELEEELTLSEAAISIRACLYDYAHNKINVCTYEACARYYFEIFNTKEMYRSDSSSKLEIICLLAVLYGELVYGRKVIYDKAINKNKYKSATNISSLYLEIREKTISKLSLKERVASAGSDDNKKLSNEQKDAFKNLVRKLCYLDLYHGYFDAYKSMSTAKNNYSYKNIAKALLRATSFVENESTINTALDKFIYRKYKESEFSGYGINFKKLKNDSQKYFKKKGFESTASTLITTVSAANSMFNICYKDYVDRGNLFDHYFYNLYFGYIVEPLYVAGQNFYNDSNAKLKNIMFENISYTIQDLLKDKEYESSEQYYWCNMSRLISTLAIKHSNQEQAISLLQMMTTFTHSSSVTYQFYKDIAKIAISLEDKETAIQNYKQAIDLTKLNSNDRELCELYDDIYVVFNNHCDAKEYFEKELESLQSVTEFTSAKRILRTILAM